MDELGLTNLLEIFIFKVDSHGEAIGECTFLCRTPQTVEEFVAGLRCIDLGQEVQIEVCIDHSQAQEVKLSKQRQMELNKI